MRRRIVLSDDEEEEFEEEEEEDGGDVGSSEEEDEEGQDEFEVDGFIVDDVEEGNGGKKEEISKEGHKKKKRRKSENEKYELDEDDYKLLEEHNITSFDRPTSSSKKFKRLKKAGRDPKHGNGRYKSKHGLFGDVKGGAFEDIVEEKQLEDEDEDTSEEDEMADFIVDEEKVDVKGLSVRKKNPNKRNPKHGAGSSSMAWQETHCIFGDVDELLRNQARNGTYDNSGEMTLEEEFEHGILGDQYTREKHEQFRKNDMPERIQLLEERTGPFPKDYESIQMESRWIYNQLVASAISSFFEKEQASNIIKDIGNVLGMLHLQKLDIPFIAMYRKELCVTLLRDPEQDYSEFGDGDKMENTPKLKWHKGLWAIQNLDKKWLLLHARKNALGLYYNKHAEEETRGDPLKKALFDSLLQSLNDATSERDIDDIDLKFDLHFGQFKIPKPKSLYRVCQMSGLGGATSKFVFSPEQFGKLLNLEKMGDRLEEAEETPEDVAARFICPEFVTPQDVLRGACHLAAVDISCDLLVRKHVCTSFMNRGVISTKPTLNGNSAIDSFHQFSGVKWLRDKPISMFNDAQWLLIQKAEEEKLLQVTVRIPDNEKGESWIQEFEEKYLSDGVSKATQLWNEQRRLILKEALSNYLIPFVEKEVRSLLTTRAKSWLIMEYGKKLWDKVSVSPYKLKDKDGGQTEMNSDTSLGDDVAPRVMACCWGPGKPETTFVMLDPSGNVLDVLYTPSLNGRSKSLTQQQRKKIDQKHVLKFMSDHQPHIVVLGAASLACTRLKDDISEIIKVIEECPGEDSQVMGGIRIVYGDESLPFLYENSQISSDQLPGQQGIARRAVALGRFLLNPLAMVATLCGPEREILSLKLHRLEHLLTPDERYEVIEQVMIDATNQVGIDLNLAACHGWLFAPLQFVSGLGPCKASFLQQAIVNSGWIYSRKEIAMNLGVKRNVFINAAGFLRVCPNSKAVSGGQIFDLLDDTRIHPESYVLAHKMVKDVYATEEDTDITEMNREAHEMTIEHVRKNPELLRVFDIEKYAERMESLGTHKLETLYDIKRELLYGFHDWRIPYSEPDPDEVFYMVCGETEETLTEGRIVQAKVIRVQSRVTCVLESGLIGLILKEDFSDDMDFDLCDKVIEGSTLTCKIKDISKDRFLVFLTCKGSELKKTRLPNYQEKDPYYCEDESSLRSSQEKARKEPTTSFKPRMITHPRFQNLTAAEVLEFLSDKEPGESIIRPSSKGPSYLTLTLKVYDGVYAHKEIAEGGKDYTDMNSLLCLGKFLKIGDDIFANLDEVIDHYVDPLVTNLKKMLSYRKFKKGSLTEVDNLLRAEKAEHPMRIVYCFGVSHEHPGAFVLSYIRSASPRHEYISLYPKGFQFRKEMFDGLERLVVYFQKNINNMQHNAMPSTSWNDSAANVSDGGCADKNDYRSSGGWGEHPSGLPRPPGRGRGRGRRGGRGGSGGEGHDSAFGSKWGEDSGSKDDNGGWGSFTDNKVQNSPADDSNGGGNGSGSGGGRWGGGGGRNSDGGSWGGGAGGGSSSDAGGGSWGGGGNGASWGGDGGNGGRGSSWGGGGGIDNGGDSWGVGGSSSGGSGRWGGGDGGDDAGGHSWGRGGGEGGNRGRGRGRRGRGGADDGGYRGNDNSWGGGGGNDDADGGSWVSGGGEGGHRGRGRGRQGRGGRWGGDGGNDNAGGGSWVDSGGEGGYRGRGRGRRGRGGSWGGGGDDGGNSWGGGGNDDINGSSWGGGGGRWADGEGSKSSRGGRWRGGGDGGGNRSNDTGRGGGDGNKSGRGGSWGGGSGSGSSWGGGGGSGSSWGGGDGGGRSWGGGGGSGNDTGLGGDCGSRKNSGGSWGGDGGGDGSKSFRSGSWGGGDGSKSDIGSKWGGVDVGGGSWGGDDTKKSGGGSSWGGDDAKKSGGGSSWGGDDAKKSGGSSSWGGDDAKKSGGGSSWGGDDGSKSDGGGKWGGGVGGGGSSWGGDDGKKSGGGSSWGGDDGRKSGVGSKSFHSGSRGGDDGGKSDGGGSWGGGVGGGSSWSGGDGSKSGGSGSWGGGCSSLGGDDGKKSGSSSSWGGDDGRKSDGGSSWGGDDGRKSGSGNSWGGDGGSGGSGNNSGGGGGDDNSWGGGSGRSKGALNESNGGDGSRGLLGRGPGGSGLLGRGPGWSGEGSDDGKRAGSSAWGS